MRAWLNPLIKDEGESGFGINRLWGSSADSFFKNIPLIFEPSPTRVSLKDALGEMVDYWQYEFSRTFVSSRIGSYTFGPVCVAGAVRNRAQW